jgi:hypothetical protein
MRCNSTISDQLTSIIREKVRPKEHEDQTSKIKAYLNKN